MRIVLINHYAGSPEHGMEYRPYYLAREWVRRGHDVTIVAATRSHLRKVNPSAPGGLRFETISGIRYAWVWTPGYRGLVARTFNMLTFVAVLLARAPVWARHWKPDLVISSSTYPLDAFPAWVLARMAGARLVHEVHDLWPLSPIELGGISPRHPFMVLMQLAEDFAYRRSDRVVSLLPKALDHMVSRGMPPEKFVYIPNGVPLDETEEEVPVPSSHQDRLDDLHDRGVFLVGYAGAHGVANALDTVLDAAALLRGLPVAFVLVGQGPEKERLAAEALKRGLENVLLLPAISRSQVPPFLREMDALYIGLQRQPLFRFGVSPNKLMDYMLASKPVIQAIRAGNDLVQEAGCGLSIEPEDPEQLAEAVRNLAATPREDRDRMGERGRRFVLARHDYRRLADDFLRAVTGRE